MQPDDQTTTPPVGDQPVSPPMDQPYTPPAIPADEPMGTPAPEAPAEPTEIPAPMGTPPTGGEQPAPETPISDQSAM